MTVDIKEAAGFQLFVRKHWQSFAKITEWIFCALCLGLVMEPAKRGELARIYLSHYALIFPTFIGYLLILSVLLLGGLFGDRLSYRTDWILSVVASGLFFVSGVLLACQRKNTYFHYLVLYQPLPYTFSLLAVSTAFSFFTSLVFGAEAWYIWKLSKYY